MSRLARIVLPTSLALALALVGCGQSSTEQPAADAGAEETATQAEDAPESGDEGAADTDVAASEDLDDLSASLRAFDPAEAEVVDDAPALDTYSTADDADDLAFDTDDAVAEGSDEQTKASNGYRAFTHGGMEIALPTDWTTTRDSDGSYILRSADRTVAGRMSAWRKQSGYTYDVTTMPQAILQTLANEGYTSFEIVDAGTLSSSRGTVCDAYLYFKCARSGDRYVFYYEYLESKNYITAFSLAATPKGWKTNYDVCKLMANSIGFAAGEAI